MNTEEQTNQDIKKGKNIFFRVNLGKGLNRLYFVITLLWFVVLNFKIASFIIDDNVNPYSAGAESLFSTLLILALVFLFPFLIYIILSIASKIILWIINGFSDKPATELQIKKTFFGDDNFFYLVKKNKRLFWGTIYILIIINVLVSVLATSYSSYEAKSKVENTSNSRYKIINP